MAGKAEIIEAIANNAGLAKKDATAALDAVIDCIQITLKKGGKDGRVAIPGLGIFSVADRKARTGINPQTKAKIKIAASKVAKFKAGKDLRELLNKKKK